MPLPIKSVDLQNETVTIGNDLTAVDTAIAALPATPLEADLPDIVQIVADLNTAAQALRGVVAEILSILTTTRVNQ